MDVLVVIGIVLIPVFRIYLWWKIYNFPDGERYLKMRYQGSFVPRNEDEVSKDK